MMRAYVRPPLTLLVAFSFLTGLVYPLLVTGIAQVAFPHQANGSLLYHDGEAVGSALVGQSFSAPRYFWGRPSATAPFPYNAAASGGSNLGPNNPRLREQVAQCIQRLRTADPANNLALPVDLVTTSGSGLDPDLSPAAAEYQVKRVARARGLPEQAVRQLVAQATQARQFGFLGEARVNVLQLNLALDNLTARTR